MSDEDISSLSRIKMQLQRSYLDPRISQAFVSIIVINLLFTLMRLQDFPALGLLGKVRVPGLMTALAAISTLGVVSGRWLSQQKWMLGLLIFESIRGVIGYLVIQSLVINDGWHFHTWRALAMYFCSMVLPVSFGFASGARLRILISLCGYMGFFLGLYAITHSGYGPGGYIGDENDNCLVLISLLPFAFGFSQVRNTPFRKVFGILAGVLLLLGVVATKSRGGFIGLAVFVLFQFILSQKKVRWVLSAALVLCISIPFVPGKYLDEIRSIGQESSEGRGTIQERFDTWNLIYRMWKDPRNTLFGVGLENTKWVVHGYEDADAGIKHKSLAGRASHSLYFQLLGDLGIWGVLLGCMVFGGSILQLRNIRRRSKLGLGILAKTEGVFKTLPNAVLGNAVEADKYKASRDVAEEASIVLMLRRETIFVRNLAAMLLCSWFGLLAAALGISIAYYPTVWFMAAFSAATQYYWLRLEKIYRELQAYIEERSHQL